MYVGIDIGGTTIKYGVITKEGKVLKKDAVATPKEKEAVLGVLATMINKEQEKHSEIKGVGISAPGIIQRSGEMTTAGALRELYGINLKQEMETRTGLPVVVENDANAAAIAERWVGAAQGVDNYLCLVLGTGVGGGIVINGQPYRGAHGMAGEFGFMMINALPEEGNLEAVSLNWLGAVVGGLIRCYNMKQAADGNPTIQDARLIFDRAADGEETATKVLAEFYQHLAVGIVNLIAAFDPECVLIGGAISENKQFLQGVSEAIDRVESRHEALAPLKNQLLGKIRPAQLKNDAGMIGAVYQMHRQRTMVTD